jgi:hypothetical protein
MLLSDTMIHVSCSALFLNRNGIMRPADCNGMEVPLGCCHDRYCSYLMPVRSTLDKVWPTGCVWQALT